MSNKYHNGQFRGVHVKSGVKAGKAPPASVPEKAGFTAAKLPGEVQRKARNAGVYKCHVYPDSKGL